MQPGVRLRLRVGGTDWLWLLRRYAASNTQRGVESCGILAGVLDEENACFQICTLIIPKQEGTSDTVQVLHCAPYHFDSAMDPPCMCPLCANTGMARSQPSQSPA